MDALKLLAVSADVITLLFGGLALYGIVFRRKDLRRALQMLSSAYLQQRFGRVRETLGKLDGLSYDRKEDRAELNALMGQLCGQLAPLLDDCPELTVVVAELKAITEHHRRLNESMKRRIMYELNGLLDSSVHRFNEQALRQKDGS